MQGCPGFFDSLPISPRFQLEIGKQPEISRLDSQEILSNEAQTRVEVIKHILRFQDLFYLETRLQRLRCVDGNFFGK